MTNPVATDFPPDATSDSFSAVRGWMRTASSRLRGLVSREPTGQVTFRASQTTTTITDPRISATSLIELSPTTANANTAWKTHYIAEPRANGLVVITHASDAAVDQTFRWKASGV